MTNEQSAASGLALNDQLISRLEASIPRAVEEAVPAAMERASPAAGDGAVPALDDSAPEAIPAAVEGAVSAALPVVLDEPITNLAPEVRDLAAPVTQMQPLLEEMPAAGSSVPANA
jgi:hypothetical protein